MLKPAIAQVAWNAQDASYQVQEGASLAPTDFEGQEWLSWLEQRTSFAFSSQDGHRFTARKEARARGSIYWIAYRKVGGKLTHTYLGRPEDVTLARLEQVARFLAGQDSLDANSLPAGGKQSRQEPFNQMRWQNQYLATKFFVPVAPHVLIARPRLFSQLEEGRLRPLTLVSAPAGFGKTTLLSAWVQAQLPDNPLVAWVSLDEADNDPVRFWSYVLTALDRLWPGMCREFVVYLQAEAHPSLNSVLTACLNRLSAHPEPVLLVLDDYHLVTEETIHTTLTSFIEHLPSQLRVILATRMDPPLPLARLRGRGQLLEVRAEQLRATQEETRAFLHEVMGVELADQELEVVEDRTEGWLAGLQLAGLSLQGRPTSIDLFEEVSGRQGYILDYLTEEVLRQQPEAIQHFLLSTSILERLTASLCDAILERTDSQYVLEALERANLFVVPLDGQHRWYRYHALFAETLRARLEQQGNEAVPALHQRASEWYAERGSFAEAVQHAIFARDWERAADLIEQNIQAHSWTEETWRTFRHWLQVFPGEVVRARPRFCLLAARALYIAASPTIVEDWLTRAETALAASGTVERRDSAAGSSNEQADRDDLLGEILALRALTALHRGDASTALALCERALTLLREQSPAVRERVTQVRDQVYGALGQLVPTSSYLQHSTYAQSVGNTGLAMTHLCEAAIRLMQQAGRLREAERLLEQAAEWGSAGRSLLYPEVSLVYAYQSLLLREWNQLDEALQLAQQAKRLIERTGEKPSQLYAHAALLRIALSRGELAEAQAALKEAASAARDSGSSYLYALLLTVEHVRIAVTSGELEQAAHLAERLHRRVGPLVPLAREREVVALARVRLVQQRPDEALSLLGPLLETATRQERWGNAIELHLLLALASQMRNDEQQALTRLSEAVRLAQPEGYIRSFVDEGVPMAALLIKLRGQQRQQGPTPYLDTLLAAFPSDLVQVGKEDYPASRLSLRQPLLDPLSARELEVLHLLAQGASNQEIAKELVVTVDTVKRHVSNILSKLGANNRTQAVNQARELGLLSPGGAR